MRLPRSALEWLIFGGAGDRRYTQDSPVLPDVWIGYGLEPGKPRQLLLTPDRDAHPGAVAVALRERLADEATGDRHRGHGIAYTQSSVAVRLDLGELVRVVMPMTAWWERMMEERKGDGKPDTDAGRSGNSRTKARAEWLQWVIESGDLDGRLAGAIAAIDNDTGAGRGRRWSARDHGEGDGSTTGERHGIPLDVAWMTRIVGWLAWAEHHPEPSPPVTDAETFRRWRGSADAPRAPDLVKALFALFVGDRVLQSLEDALPAPLGDSDARVWLVNRNRPAQLAIRDSRLAIKADAAWRVFDMSCRDLTWAVIDSGIDATHPAFRKPDPDRIDPATNRPRPYGQPFEPVDGALRNRTRVARTFDFSRVRLLLDPTLLDSLASGASSRRSRGTLPKRMQATLEELVGPADLWPVAEDREVHLGMLRDHVQDLRALIAGAGVAETRLRDQLDDLRKRLLDGRDVDWALLEPFLEIRPDQYWIPAADHGTHVAGILAGNWEADGRRYHGICPDLELYDFRVLPTGRSGPDDEFNVIAALQFLRHLNRQRDHFLVHGANLSLSIPHEVANFACGRTPVCDEATRVVADGIVVVTAAGNNGYLRYQTAQGEREGYQTISITDPGNADAVITVGATHRNRPHTYGVSYFSSRGPTGDGRPKPDLVAPGEKISSAVLNGSIREKDGTSMAAPHVSGAAAILLARHRELIGQPARIKEILCASATDLGRENYFQGRGMLDVLRALQAV